MCSGKTYDSAICKAARRASGLMISSRESALRLLKGTLTPRWEWAIGEGEAAARKAREEVTKAMVNIVDRRWVYGVYGVKMKVESKGKAGENRGGPGLLNHRV